MFIKLNLFQTIHTRKCKKRHLRVIPPSHMVSHDLTDEALTIKVNQITNCTVVNRLTAITSCSSMCVLNCSSLTV